MDRIDINFKTGRVVFSRAPKVRRSQPGDVCRDKNGLLWICVQSTHGGAFVVANGRPVCHWINERGGSRESKPRGAPLVGKADWLDAKRAHRKFWKLDIDEREKVLAEGQAVPITVNE